MNEKRYRLNEAGRDALLLWIQHVPPGRAPQHLRPALRMFYQDFEAVSIGIGLMFQLRTVDCKTPAQLRTLAQVAVDKLNEVSANGVPTELAAARYKAWASRFDVAA